MLNGVMLFLTFESPMMENTLEIDMVAGTKSKRDTRSRIMGVSKRPEAGSDAKTNNLDQGERATPTPTAKQRNDINENRRNMKQDLTDAV